MVKKKKHPIWAHSTGWFSFQNGILMGGYLCKKIGTEKVKFLRHGRHIHNARQNNKIICSCSWKIINKMALTLIYPPHFEDVQCQSGVNYISRGGTDLESGYGDVRPWRPPFHASPVSRKGPISSKRVSSQDPLLRKFGKFSLNSLNFHPIFSSQAPKFWHFQLTSPQIWKFSAHKPPNLEIFRSQAPLFRGKCQFASPTLRKSGPHTPTWKKLSAPPGLHLWSLVWLCIQASHISLQREMSELCMFRNKEK